MGVLPFSFYRGCCSSFLEGKWRNFFCLTKGAAICMYFFLFSIGGGAIFSPFFTKGAHCPCYFPTLQRGRSLHTFISFPESPRTFLSLQRGRSLWVFFSFPEGSAVSLFFLLCFSLFVLFKYGLPSALVLSLKIPDFTFILCILTD